MEFRDWHNVYAIVKDCPYLYNVLCFNDEVKTLKLTAVQSPRAYPKDKYCGSVFNLETTGSKYYLTPFWLQDGDEIDVPKIGRCRVNELRMYENSIHEFKVTVHTYEINSGKPHTFYLEHITELKLHVCSDE